MNDEVREEFIEKDMESFVFYVNNLDFMLWIVWFKRVLNRGVKWLILWDFMLFILVIMWGIRLIRIRLLGGRLVRNWGVSECLKFKSNNGDKEKG